MKALNRRSTVTCLVGAALALLPVNAATGQQTCYRLTDLKALGFAPGPDGIFGTVTYLRPG
ncbi:MAG: hypothetical protein IH830_00045 [Planctomycetes bacterium]|nr:hypothetical protein [Planctomycetota bacterium]